MGYDEAFKACIAAGLEPHGDVSLPAMQAALAPSFENCNYNELRSMFANFDVDKVRLKFKKLLSDTTTIADMCAVIQILYAAVASLLFVAP